MYDFEQAINDRRSIRMFLPDKSVPRELVDQALELAIRFYSETNDLALPGQENLPPAVFLSPARQKVMKNHTFLLP